MGQINYVAAAAAIDPNVSFTTMSDVFTYETLEWTSTPIQKSTLEAHYLGQEKARIAKALNDAATAEAQLGMLSDALVPGVFRKYSTTLQGQIVIIGTCVVAFNAPDDGRTVVLINSDPVTGAIEFSPHSRSQLERLLVDIGNFSNNKIIMLGQKTATVMMTNTGNVSNDLDTIRAIQWP